LEHFSGTNPETAVTKSNSVYQAKGVKSNSYDKGGQYLQQKLWEEQDAHTFETLFISANDGYAGEPSSLIYNNYKRISKASIKGKFLPNHY
jgi:hypothetical protein